MDIVHRQALYVAVGRLAWLDRMPLPGKHNNGLAALHHVALFSNNLFYRKILVVKREIYWHNNCNSQSSEID